MLPTVDHKPARFRRRFPVRSGWAISLGGNALKMEPCGDDLTPTTAKIVFVEWEDIQSHEDWNEESDGNTTCSLKSIGWLIEDDDRKLVIAATYDHENERWANKFAIGKLPPEVTALTVTEGTRQPTYKDALSFEDLIEKERDFFRHVPRRIDEATEEERRALNPNHVSRVWPVTMPNGSVVNVELDHDPGKP